MNTITQRRRQAVRLVFSGFAIGLMMTLTFGAHAQTAPASKPKQGAAASPGKSHAKEMALELEGLSRLELEKAQLELERAREELLKQDWKKLEAEMVRAKEEIEKALKASEEALEIQGLQQAMAEAEKGLAKQQGQIAKAMKKADWQLQQARKRIDLMNKGMELMEKEGLIKPGESINLEWEGDTMILNGKKQSKAISDKYRKYFRHDSDQSQVVI